MNNERRHLDRDYAARFSRVEGELGAARGATTWAYTPALAPARIQAYSASSRDTSAYHPLCRSLRAMHDERLG